MSYRVETASSGRAVCRATECKKNGVKIDKDELRMGTWAEIMENGSWQWKHWGCVTGYQLQNLRNNLEDPENPGVYRWDFLDGYEGEEKNSLDKYPELQDKVRRVITQGFIDPEDFNGDAEMNKLGEKGLYTTETKRKMRQDQINRTQEIEELKAKVEALTAEREHAIQNGKSTKKVDVKMEVVKDELEDFEKGTKGAANKTVKADPSKKKTAKRKRSNAIKEEVDDDDEEDDDYVKPVKKSRAKKAKKEGAEKIKEEDDDVPATVTAPKKRGAEGKRVIKDEPLSDQDDDAGQPEVKPKPTKKSKGKKAVKEESDDEPKNIDHLREHPATMPKDQTKKGSKKAIKQELTGSSPSTLKGDPSELIDSNSETLAAAPTEIYIPGIKDSDLQYSFDMALEAGEIDDDFEAYVETMKAQIAPPQQKKGAKGKKTGASKSKRSSRTKSK